MLLGMGWAKALPLTKNAQSKKKYFIIINKRYA